MKKIWINILCSTAITLLLLAVLGEISGAQCLFIHSVFESFFVNIVVHTGLIYTRRFESSYAVLEFMLDISYTVIIVIIFGAIFNWYGSIPIWTLVIMTAIVYFAGILLNIISMRREIEEINELLQKRNTIISKESEQ